MNQLFEHCKFPSDIILGPIAMIGLVIQESNLIITTSVALMGQSIVVYRLLGLEVQEKRQSLHYL
jgi:hypothetical protein